MNWLRVRLREAILIGIGLGLLFLLWGHVQASLHYRTTVEEDAFSSDGRLIARAWNHPLYVYSAETGKTVRRFEHFGECVDISPDSRRLAAGSILNNDAVIRVWDLDTGALVHALRGHKEWITRVKFAAGGRLLISASRDETLRVWDLADGRIVHTLQAPTRVDAMDVSPDGSLIAAGVGNPANSTHEIRLWTVADGTLRKILVGKEHAYVETVRFSQDGALIAVGLSVPTLRVWDVERGVEVVTLPTAGRGGMLFVGRPDRLVVLSHEGADLWDLKEKKSLRRFLPPPDRHGWSALQRGAYFDVGANVLVTTDLDATVRRWDLESGRELSAVSGESGDWRWRIWVLFGLFTLWVPAWLRFVGPNEPFPDDRSPRVLAVGLAGFALHLLLSFLFLSGNSPFEVAFPVAALTPLTLVVGLLIWIASSRPARRRPLFVLIGLLPSLAGVVYAAWSIVLTIQSI